MLSPEAGSPGAGRGADGQRLARDGQAPL